jgi:hypothetical protein
VSRHRSLASALVISFAFVGACSSASKSVTVPEVQSLRCPAAAAGTTSMPSSLSALNRLAHKESAAITGRIVHFGHGRAGAEPPIALDRNDTIALAHEITIAADVACRLRTQADAERAGYVLSSDYTQGVGTHWTNWSLVDAPFDPTRPSMLLYAPHLGAVQLVGFSYWVRSDAADGPAGFTGDADHWHRHFGLCFDRQGMLQREDVTRPAACNGPWLNGKDLWMLHAWIVPGAENAWGLFAPLNPSLCSRTAPDIARCPDPEPP